MTVEIPLSQGLVAIVDDEDAHRVLAEGKWCASKHGHTFYARRNGRRPDGGWTTYKLHNFITGWSYVDHVNGDGLDCTRGNLRQATYAQNAYNSRRRINNTSGFTGVSWKKRQAQWHARIRIYGLETHLGYFDDPIEAARAYDAVARELHGDFARLNFPKEES